MKQRDLKVIASLMKTSISQEVMARLQAMPADDRRWYRVFSIVTQSEKTSFTIRETVISAIAVILSAVLTYLLSHPW